MKDPFDPYRKWLGISPEDRPPHHYRLLGIEPLEPDPDVIANAADGRMAQVKNFQIGKYSQLSQRILNEIAAARLCLLSPERKKQYDRKLRPRLEAEMKGLPQAAPPAVRKPPPRTGPASQTSIPAIETSSVFSYVSHRSRKRPAWKILAALGLGAVAIGVLAIGVLAIALLGRGNGPPTAQQPPSSGVQREELRPDSIQEPPAQEPPAEALPIEDPVPPDDPPAGPETDPQRPPLDAPGSIDLTPPQSDPGRPLADLLDPLDPDQPGGNGPVAWDSEAPAADDPSQNVSTVAKRLPVPHADARRDAEQRIREIFKSDFADVATPQKKLALAVKFSSQANDATGDPTDRFVLMELAREMSAAAGELTTALDAAERMRQLFDIDVLSVKASVLDKVAETVQSGAPTSATSQQIVDQAMLLADRAVAADGFSLAGRLVKLALSTARKMKDAELLRWLTTRHQEIGRMKVRFIAVTKALDLLADEPAHAGANLTVGRWYCFNAGNWAKGLPALAKGTDAQLSKLAAQDLARPQDPKQRKTLAERWWDLAKKERGPQQRGIQARARHWYELAVAGLTGLDRTGAERRLAEMTAAAEPWESRIRGTVKEGNVALAGNGTTLAGVAAGSQFLLDGKVPADRTGIASSPFPCEWTITFDQTYRLREIRFLLYDIGNRYYRYAVKTSADATTFTLLADRSQGQWASWQRIAFPPRPVKAIKLMGLYNSKSPRFHVLEFEAFCIPTPAVPR